MAEEVVNLKPVSCTASTLTTPATTAGVLEALKKPVKETSAALEEPEKTKLVEDALIGHKAELKFETAPLAGKTIIASATSHALHLYSNTASSTKRLKFGGSTPTISATPGTGSGGEWTKIQLTKAQAEELNTVAKIEAWVAYLESIESKVWKAYAFYLSVTIEAEEKKSTTAKTSSALSASAKAERTGGVAASLHAALSGSATVLAGHATTAASTTGAHTAAVGSGIRALASSASVSAALSSVVTTVGGVPKFNVSYGEHGAANTLDAYPAVVPNSPIVVVVHGGGWAEGGKGEVTVEAEDLQRNGSAVLNIEYREASVSVSAFPKQCEDLEAAVAWGIANATELNGNPRKVFLLGGSSGGQLVAITACRMNSSAIRGVISLSGPFDLPKLRAELANEEGEEKVIGEPEKLEKHLEWALQCAGIAGETGNGCKTTSKLELGELYSATRQTTPRYTKWLLFNGDKEKIPQPHILTMAAHLEAQAQRVTKYVLRSDKHAFSNWNHKLTGTGETAPTVQEAIYAFIAEAETEASPRVAVGAGQAIVGARVASTTGAVTAGTRSLASAEGTALAAARITIAAHTGAAGERVASTASKVSSGARTTASRGHRPAVSIGVRVAALVERTGSTTAQVAGGGHVLAAAERTSTTAARVSIGTRQSVAAERGRAASVSVSVGAHTTAIRATVPRVSVGMRARSSGRGVATPTPPTTLLLRGTSSHTALHAPTTDFSLRGG